MYLVVHHALTPLTRYAIQSILLVVYVLGNLLLLLYSFTVSSTEGLTATCAAAFELS